VLEKGDKILVWDPTTQKNIVGKVESNGKLSGRKTVNYATSDGSLRWAFLCNVVKVNGQDAPIAWQAE
jgi:hypothetical protein